MTPVVTQVERRNVLMGNDLVSAAGLIKIIDESRQNALKKVNEELIKIQVLVCYYVLLRMMKL